MRRLKGITWHALAAVSALILLTLLFLIHPEATRHTIGSTEIYSVLDGDRLIVDVHDRHGWWNLFDQPLLALWLLPAVVLIVWAERLRRRIERAGGITGILVRYSSVLAMIGVLWLPLVIRIYGLDQVGDRFFLALCSFIAFAGVACAMWVLMCLIIYAARVPQRKRQRRIEQGLCVRCGYSLTGNVSGLCPEYGSATLRGVGS